MAQIVVAEDVPLALAMADAGDHRGVVQRVGEDDQARQDGLQGFQRGLVGDIAGGEKQCRFLAMQVGQFGLELDVIVGRAGNVARPARTGAGLFQCLVHGVQHDFVLALAEIIVGTPDGDFFFPAGTGPGRLRKPAANALKIGENPVTAFLPKRLYGILKVGLVGKQHETRLLGSRPSHLAR